MDVIPHLLSANSAFRTQQTIAYCVDLPLSPFYFTLVEDVLPFRQPRRRLPSTTPFYPPSSCHSPTPPLLPCPRRLDPPMQNQHHLMPYTMTKRTPHMSPQRKRKRKRKRRMRKMHIWSIGNQMTRQILAIGQRPTRAG